MKKKTGEWFAAATRNLFRGKKVILAVFVLTAVILCLSGCKSDRAEKIEEPAQSKETINTETDTRIENQTTKSEEPTQSKETVENEAKLQRDDEVAKYEESLRSQVATLDEAGLHGNEGISYLQAYDLFSAFYRDLSHAEYLNRVSAEIVIVKDNIAKCNDEILELLKSGYQSINGSSPAISYENYCETFITPYESYYAGRMSSGSDAREAYIRVGESLTYGGNIGPDIGLLWTYVYYQNFYNELTQLKEFILQPTF